MTNVGSRNPGTAGHPCMKYRFGSPACETKNQVNAHATDTIIIINLTGKAYMYIQHHFSFYELHLHCMHACKSHKDCPTSPHHRPANTSGPQGGKGLGGRATG